MSNNATPSQVVPANSAKLIDYVAVTTAAMQKAAEAEKRQRETEDAVRALIPAICDTMETFERSNPSEREKLAAGLMDPVFALKLLNKVAGHRNKAEMAVLGQAAGEHNKQAAAGSDGQPYRGYAGERTGQIKESDQRWFSGLGVTLGAGS